MQYNKLSGQDYDRAVKRLVMDEALPNCSFINSKDGALWEIRQSSQGN